MTDIALLTAELKNRAYDLGFAAVGVAPTTPLQLAEQAIQERVESGRLRDYGFTRKSPKSLTCPGDLVVGARSMVAVAWPYLSDETKEKGGEIRGRVARFARGQDYHKVVTERLMKLGEWLTSQVEDASYHICVDTGSLIDRAVACQAGIGSYGKNAMIIIPEAGSWVVLGELIANVELDYDQPAQLENCGDCSICINACPSGAIVAPFVIDQTKCISHLTQMKGFIPQELRSLIGDRIYGCDVCQEVCPKNADVIVNGQTDLSIGLSACPELIPLLNISQEEFDWLIGPTAIAWIGRTSFRRNVAVALGNICDSSAVPEIKIALQDSEPVIRAHAAWALGQISSPEVESVLKSVLEYEDDPRVVEEIESAIGLI